MYGSVPLTVPSSETTVLIATSVSVIRARPKSRILMSGMPSCVAADVHEGPAADHLQRHCAPRVLLLRLVDDPHSPFPELSDDAEGPDRPRAGERRGGHGRVLRRAWTGRRSFGHDRPLSPQRRAALKR